MLLSKSFQRKLGCTIALGLILLGTFSVSLDLRPTNAQGDWWDSSWLHRKTVTINHTKVAADLANFPVLVDIVDSDLSSKAQSSGNDIVFTDSSMNKLSHEIERYDNNTGHLVAWVKVPSLSSTSDTVLYMYYGNAAASNQQNPTAVWDPNYMMVQHLEETLAVPPPEYWHQYEGNPILTGSTDGFGSVFYDSSSGIYHFYCSWGSILHYTSPNGKTGWTADPLNPMLTGNNEGVPTVWKEDGVWHMLYRYGGPYKVGLANSTDGSHWTRYEGNPVIDVGQLDPWGIIKVGSTYYLWINDGFGGSGRGSELATSTDLIHWTTDTNAIFSGGRFCVFPFKYGAYYYMLVPHYTTGPYGEIELYRCSSPTFYQSQRQYLGIVVPTGSAGSWNQYRHDTPCVLTDTIYRDTFAAANNELWMYYASTPDSGGAWLTGMCIEQNISKALSRPPIVTSVVDYDSTSNQNNGKVYGNVNQNATGKIDGANGFDGSSGTYIDCGDNASLKGMSSLTIETWVKPNAIAGSGIFSKWGSWSSGSYIMWQSGTGVISWGVITESTYTSIASGIILQAGQWYHIVGVYDGAQIRLYVNGTQAGPTASITGKIKSTSDPCYVAKYSTVNLNGIMDEVRVSNTTRTASWVSTEYNNQNSPSTFYTVGNEETRFAKVYVDPSLIEKGPSDIGTTFKMNVTIDNVKDMWGFDFNLTWDGSLLTLVSVDFNSTLDAVWGHDNWFLAYNQSGAGYYQLAAVSLSTGFNSTGPTPLATLTLRVEDPLTNFMKETAIHFGIHKFSDSSWASIGHTAEDGTYRITGGIPRLDMNPTTKICRTYNETFTVQINVTNAGEVKDFRFEIHYNATLLDVANVSWDAWQTGTITIDEVNGNITGYTYGSQISGNKTFVEISFNATYYHIWKDESTISGWKNTQTGIIFFQWANLSYAATPDLRYERGGLNQINVGQDVQYTFQPIQGDIDNNGAVDIFDLRTIAALYDTTNPQYNLTGDSVIDIYDLVIVGANFNYTYNP